MSEARTITFSGTCSAGSELVISSKRIPFPFTVKSFVCSFALNTNRTLQLSPFSSPDPTEPTSGKPTGLNLLSMLGDQSYMVGDDEQVVMPIGLTIHESGMFLKIYANNTDGDDHSVNGHFIITPLERKAAPDG